MSNPDRVSRRAFVVGTVAAAVSVAEGGAPRDSKPSATLPLTELSACDAVESMVRGELTAERYAGAQGLFLLRGRVPSSGEACRTLSQCRDPAAVW